MPEPAVPVPHTRFGPFDLDARTGELRKGPTRLKVPDQSIEILKALLEHPGDLVTREQLRDRLWPSNTFVDFEHGLNAAIRRLREALGDSADAPRFIETLPRRGYRFIGPLEGASTLITAEISAPIALEPSSAPESVTSSAPPRAGSSGRFSVRMRRLVLAASIVLAVAIGLWVGHATRESASSALSVTAPSIPVTSFPGVEVDPALSPDGNQLAFAWDGEAEDNLDIYVKLRDAGELVRLTTDAAAERAPAWSPDGQRIAFLRATRGGAAVVVIPALGGPERLVTQTQVAVPDGQFRSNGISWTPDGKALLVVDSALSGGSAIFVSSLDTGERRQLTRPTQDASDSAPAVSPDGRYLAFVRRTASYTDGGVFVLQLDALQTEGEPRRLTHDDRIGTLAWTHDSGSIVYDNAEKGLWRVPITGGQPQPVLMNVRASGPSVARNGRWLAYQDTTTDANIWRMPGPEAWNRGESQPVPERIVASTFSERSPQFSPDGRRIAFVSSRSGKPEIWASRRDGLQPMQLTAFAGAALGSPRWSPGQESIAFDSMRSGSWNIYVVGAEDGRTRAVTADGSSNVRPSWCRDGRWIYFGSNRSGEWQLWKVPAAGGTPIQITKRGGYEAFESPDGTHLYYAKAPGTSGIWEVSVEGGDEVQLIDHGREISWSVTATGIALLDHLAKPQARVEFFSFASRRVVAVRQFPRGLRFAPSQFPHFAVSRDGQWMLYVQYDQWGSDIHMLEGSW